MPQKILVVEDDADWQARIRERLEGLGYEIALASSALEARTKILPNPKDYVLILLDPSLTQAGDDKEGLVFLDQVRDQGVQTPCILLTVNLTKTLAKTVLSTSKYKVSAALEKGDFLNNPALVTGKLEEATKSAPVTETPQETVKSARPTADHGASVVPEYWGIALLTIVSTVALIAVLWATVAAVSWLLQNAGGAAVVVLLALVAVILLFYVLNLWIAIFKGRIKGKTARKMGRDALAKIPILGPLLIHPSQEDDNSE
jgi:CheY-like chemotaxis protein